MPAAPSTPKIKTDGYTPHDLWGKHTDRIENGTPPVPPAAPAAPIFPQGKPAYPATTMRLPPPASRAWAALPDSQPSAMPFQQRLAHLAANGGGYAPAYRPADFSNQLLQHIPGGAAAFVDEQRSNYQRDFGDAETDGSGNPPLIDFDKRNTPVPVVSRLGPVNFPATLAQGGEGPVIAGFDLASLQAGRPVHPVDIPSAQDPKTFSRYHGLAAANFRPNVESLGHEMNHAYAGFGKDPGDDSMNANYNLSNPTQSYATSSGAEYTQAATAGLNAMRDVTGHKLNTPQEVHQMFDEIQARPAILNNIAPEHARLYRTYLNLMKTNPQVAEKLRNAVARDSQYLVQEQPQQGSQKLATLLRAIEMTKRAFDETDLPTRTVYDKQWNANTVENPAFEDKRDWLSRQGAIPGIAQSVRNFGGNLAHGLGWAQTALPLGYFADQGISSLMDGASYLHHNWDATKDWAMGQTSNAKKWEYHPPVDDDHYIWGEEKTQPGSRSWISGAESGVKSVADTMVRSTARWLAPEYDKAYGPGYDNVQHGGALSAFGNLIGSGWKSSDPNRRATGYTGYWSQPGVKLPPKPVAPKPVQPMAPQPQQPAPPAQQPTAPYELPSLEKAQSHLLLKVAIDFSGLENRGHAGVWDSVKKFPGELLAGKASPFRRPLDWIGSGATFLLDPLLTKAVAPAVAGTADRLRGHAASLGEAIKPYGQAAIRDTVDEAAQDDVYNQWGKWFGIPDGASRPLSTLAYTAVRPILEIGSKLGDTYHRFAGTARPLDALNKNVELRRAQEAEMQRQLEELTKQQPAPQA